MALVHVSFGQLGAIDMASTDGGRVLIEDCCLMAKGQWLCPALAGPRVLCLFVSVSC